MIIQNDDQWLTHFSDGKWTAFIKHTPAATQIAFHITQHSLVHTHIYVSYARRQPAHQEQLGLGALLRDTTTLSQEEPGIEPATLRLPANLLFPLS